MESIRAVPDEKIWGSLKAKHYIFVGLVGVGCFSIQWVVVFYENVILSFSKMQFCGYASFKWDLAGCLGLNTQKNEKKTVPIL